MKHIKLFEKWNLSDGEISTITPPHKGENNSKFWDVEYREPGSDKIHTKHFDTEEEAIEFNKIKKFRANIITLEVLPKFWEDMGVKRARSSFEEEAGHSYLTRGNQISLKVEADPIHIYRRDTKIWNELNQRAGRDESSIFYLINLYRTPEGILKYGINWQKNSDALLGGNLNLIGLSGEHAIFKSEDVGTIDKRGYFKIVDAK